MKPLGRPLSGLKIKMPKMPTAVSASVKPSGSPTPLKPMNSGQVGVRTPKTKSMPEATDKPSVFYKSEDTPKKTSVQNLRDFLDGKHKNQSIQQSSDQTESPCMSKKTYSPVDAAKAVLAKTHEMLSKSIKRMEKAETGHEKGVHVKTPNRAEGSEAGNKLKTWPKSDAAKGPKMAKLVSDAHGQAKEAHKKVLGEMKAMPKPDLGKSEEVGQPMAGKVKQLQTETENLSTPDHLPQNTEKFASELRGHLKLAKFVGRMEEKRKSKPDNTDLNPNAPKEGKDFGASDPKATGKAPKAGV